VWTNTGAHADQHHHRNADEHPDRDAQRHGHRYGEPQRHRDGHNDLIADRDVYASPSPTAAAAQGGL
jgi:hypothetical protein